MPLSNRPDVVSLIVGALVALAAGALMAWQIRDRERRQFDDLSDEDDGYFRRQDRRRLIGGLVMLLLAVGVVVGTRIHPGEPRRPNFDFVRIWIGVGALLLFLLGLAMRDWIETRFYALRHREIIRLARLQLLEDELNRRRSANAGSGGNGEVVAWPEGDDRA
ncbi:hypothetical protein EP7_001396 [Isosphaeraceae bacterium EP7]